VKRPFIHEDFLLESDVAQDLYHRCAASLPIVDYHCHLPVEQIAKDHRFRSLTEIWTGDSDPGQEIRAGLLVVQGAGSLGQLLWRWLGRSMFAPTRAAR